MATSQLYNIIKDASGTPLENVTIEARLKPAPGFRISDNTEVQPLVTTTTDSNGYWSLDLEQQANITTDCSYWEISELFNPREGGPQRYAVSIGDTDSSLAAAAVSVRKPTSVANISQSDADARYILLGGSAGTTSDSAPDDSVAAGSEDAPAHADHRHGRFPYANESADLLRGFSPSLGFDDELSRADHQHRHRGNFWKFCATHSVNESFTTGVAAVKSFNTELWDEGGCFASNTCTIPTGADGLWLFGSTIRWAFNSTGYRQNLFLVNGGFSAAAHGNIQIDASGSTFIVPIHMIRRMTAGDTVTVRVFQNSGGNLNADRASATSGRAYAPLFWGTYLGT